METHVEIERKYEVPAEFTLPDLAAVPQVAAVHGPVEHHLDAVYYDTVGLRLAGNRTTLRHRSGGDDAGWHLKRPTADGERSETRIPAGSDNTGVPEALALQVKPIIGDEPLAPVATIRTTRLEYTICGPDGSTLALVADDRVAGEALGTGGAVQQWRELEVELAGGDHDLLRELNLVLTAAGASPAGSASKLARVLAARP